MENPYLCGRELVPDCNLKIHEIFLDIFKDAVDKSFANIDIYKQIDDFIYCKSVDIEHSFDLLDLFIDNGVPFDLYRDDLFDDTDYVYTGIRYSIEGEIFKKEVALIELQEPVFGLASYLEQHGPSELIKHINSLNSHIKSLSWDNQIENSKLYLINKLLMPDDD